MGLLPELLVNAGLVYCLCWGLCIRCLIGGLFVVNSVVYSSFFSVFTLICVRGC